jgi:hypothetical protein
MPENPTLGSLSCVNGCVTGASVEGLNHSCYCLSVDSEALRLGLREDLKQHQLSDEMIATHPDPNMVGWAEEISLDVEWAHAMAPGAKIVLVLAKSNADSDIASALNYAVTNNLGNVISMSFGENESCLAPADQAS